MIKSPIQIRLSEGTSTVLQNTRQGVGRKVGTLRAKIRAANQAFHAAGEPSKGPQYSPTCFVD